MEDGGLTCALNVCMLQSPNRCHLAQLLAGQHYEVPNSQVYPAPLFLHITGYS